MISLGGDYSGLGSGGGGARRVGRGYLRQFWWWAVLTVVLVAGGDGRAGATNSSSVGWRRFWEHCGQKVVLVSCIKTFTVLQEKKAVLSASSRGLAGKSHMLWLVMGGMRSRLPNRYHSIRGTFWVLYHHIVWGDDVECCKMSVGRMKHFAYFAVTVDVP